MPFTQTAQLLGNLGEFAGAIAIVVTLGYLAVQIKQSNNLLASQARYNLFVRRSDLASSLQDRFLLESAHKYLAGEDVSGPLSLALHCSQHSGRSRCGSGSTPSMTSES